jgi:arsenite methyltransferase
VSWHSADPDRMRRVLAIWDGHLADPCLPRTLAARLGSAGFGDIRAKGHTFTSAEFTPNATSSGSARPPGWPRRGLVATAAAGRR